MKNITSVWPNLFRAIEIAKIGGYSVSVHFQPDYKAGFEDYRYIKDFCRGWFEKFVEDGDIKVELIQPNNYTKGWQSESLADISIRVKTGLANSLPCSKLSESGESLLKNAARVLSLSLYQIEKIRLISLTIARADNSKNIEPQHVAEALQYSYLSPDTINAEVKTRNFGDNIKIKLGDIDKEDIQNAIEYLTSKLN